MRTALLAALDHGDGGILRAGLLLGGHSVLAWQGRAVRAIGCERVICLIDHFGEDVIALQRAVESNGGEFHAVRSGRQLPGLLRAEDELVVLLDGLVVDPETLQAVTRGDGDLAKGVATLPANHPLAQAHPDAFERIDRERAWAGVLVMRAAPARQLADLPGDGAVVPLLLRLALQSGIADRPVLPEMIGEGEWLLATSGEALAGRERTLIERSLAGTSWAGAGLVLAQTIARRLAPRATVSMPLAAAGAALALLVAGAVLAGFGFAPAGLAVAAAGALAGASAQAAARVTQALLGADAPRLPGGRFMALSDMFASVALALAVLSSGAGTTGVAAAALGPLAVGLARLAQGESGPRARDFWTDRPVQLAALALAAGFDLLAPALAVFCLCGVGRLLLRSARDAANTGLTMSL